MKKHLTKKILSFLVLIGIDTASAEQQLLPTEDYLAINEKAVNKHIIPQYENFYSNMKKWHNSVKNLCQNPNATNLKQTQGDFKYVAMGWSGIMSLNFGSITAFDTYKKIDFWPDKKSFINRGLKKALKKKPEDLFDKITEDRATPVYMSFNSSERLLFKFNDAVITDKYACKLLQTQAQNAEKRAGQVLADWQSEDGYKSVFIPIDEGDAEVHISNTSELYKASMLGLQLIVDKTIGEPLSKAKKKGRPFFAQYPYSRQSKTAVQGLYDSSRKLVLEIFKDIIIKQNGQKNYDRLVKLFNDGQKSIDNLDKDIYTLASSKDGRKKLSQAQEKIKLVRQVAVREINLALSIPLGFNGLDGD